jgi:vacuolar-type H+-ATPase subunit I/STV1
MNIQQINDDDDNTQRKSVYIIVFWDGQNIRDRIQKICDSFTGQRYDLPEMKDMNSQVEKLKKSIMYAASVYKETKNQLRAQLVQFDTIQGNQEVGGQGRKKSSTIYIFKMFVAKEKALY